MLRALKLTSMHEVLGGPNVGLTYLATYTHFSSGSGAYDAAANNDPLYYNAVESTAVWQESEITEGGVVNARGRMAWDVLHEICGAFQGRLYQAFGMYIFEQAGARRTSSRQMVYNVDESFRKTSTAFPEVTGEEVAIRINGTGSVYKEKGARWRFTPTYDKVEVGVKQYRPDYFAYGLFLPGPPYSGYTKRTIEDFEWADEVLSYGIDGGVFLNTQTLVGQLQRRRTGFAGLIAWKVAIAIEMFRINEDTGDEEVIRRFVRPATHAERLDGPSGTWQLDFTYGNLTWQGAPLGDFSSSDDRYELYYIQDTSVHPGSLTFPISIIPKDYRIIGISRTEDAHLRFRIQAEPVMTQEAPNMNWENYQHPGGSGRDPWLCLFATGTYGVARIGGITGRDHEYTVTKGNGRDILSVDLPFDNHFRTGGAPYAAAPWPDTLVLRDTAGAASDATGWASPRLAGQEYDRLSVLLADMLYEDYLTPRPLNDVTLYDQKGELHYGCTVRRGSNVDAFLFGRVRLNARAAEWTGTLRGPRLTVSNVVFGNPATNTAFGPAAVASGSGNAFGP